MARIAGSAWTLVGLTVATLLGSACSDDDAGDAAGAAGAGSAGRANAGAGGSASGSGGTSGNGGATAKAGGAGTTGGSASAGATSGGGGKAAGSGGTAAAGQSGGGMSAGSAGGSGEAGEDGAGGDGTSADRGTLIGSFIHTFYWMEFESDYTGARDTELLDAGCDAVATVPKAFADRVCVEGSGRLEDGSLLNLEGDCSCGYACEETDATVCFFREEEPDAAWGYGSADNALEPLRSLAVDESEIPHGTLLYIPEWDGVSVPESQGIGGFVHDGCFRADDIGYGIDGRHYDFYAGTSELWDALEAVNPTNSTTTVYRDPPRCANR